MSIISQALMRAERERQGGQKFYTQKKRGQAGRWFAALIVLAIVIATPFAAPHLTVSKTASTSELPGSETLQIAQTEAQDQKGSAQFAMESTPIIPPAGFVTPGAANILKEDYKLSGVFQDGNGFYAIINNAIVKEGSKMGNALVTSVTLDAVTLSIDGQEFVLRKDF